MWDWENKTLEEQSKLVPLHSGRITTYVYVQCEVFTCTGVWYSTRQCMTMPEQTIDVEVKINYYYYRWNFTAPFYYRSISVSAT